jgi:hypothetical protein
MCPANRVQVEELLGEGKLKKLTKGGKSEEENKIVFSIYNRKFLKKIKKIWRKR